MLGEALLLSCWKEPVPIPDGMLCNRLLHPEQLMSPGCATPLILQLTTVTLSHLSPQEDFANTCQGICSYKGFVKC